MRCVVTGATGYVGGRLVPQLLDRGHDVRAVARTPSKLANVPWRDDAKVVRGDLADADSLIAAFDGADVVYYLVHSMGTSRDFAAEEERAADNVVTAARRAGVRRLVYLGGLHPSDAKLSPHLRSRTTVGEILLASDIETVVLQAGVIVGSGSASFEMIRHLTDRLPVMTTPNWVHNKIQPIAVRDALHYLVEAATAEVPESRPWDIGGPDVLEYGEMMQIYADVAGLHRRAIVALPFPHTGDRELVGRTGHADTVRIGPPAGGIAALRRCDGQPRHRRGDTAPSERTDRLPRLGVVGTQANCRRDGGTIAVAAQRSGLGRRRRLHPRTLRLDSSRRRPTVEADRKQPSTTELASEGARAGSPPAPSQERNAAWRRMAANARGYRVWPRQYVSPANDILPQGNSRAHLLVRRIAAAPQTISGTVPRRALPRRQLTPLRPPQRRHVVVL